GGVEGGKVRGERGGGGGKVLNVARGTETSLNELAEAVLRVMRSSLRPEYREERKVNPVQRRLADVDKARRLLGFEARTSLDDGLRCLVDWWREQKLVAA